MSEKKSKWKRWAKEIVIFAAIFLAVHLWQTRHAASGPAPTLESEGLDAPVSLSALKGKPALVHFWATWCGVCQAEEGSIDSLSKSAPVLTVAVSSGEAGKVAAYRKERGLSFDAALDPEGDIAARWGVKAFPTTFFVDGDGQIRAVTTGWTSSLGLRARLLWASLF